MRSVQCKNGGWGGMGGTDECVEGVCCSYIQDGCSNRAGLFPVFRFRVNSSTVYVKIKKSAEKWFLSQINNVFKLCFIPNGNIQFYTLIHSCVKSEWWHEGQSAWCQAWSWNVNKYKSVWTSVEKSELQTQSKGNHEALKSLHLSKSIKSH